MSNMSYCRFENTARDLGDCMDAIEAGEIDDLSQTERNGLDAIYQIAKNMVELWSVEVEEATSKTDED